MSVCGHTAACCIQRPDAKVVYNAAMNEPNSSPCSMRAEDLRVTANAEKENRKPMFSIKSANTILYCENWDACVHFGKGITLSWQVDELEGLRDYLVNNGVRVTEIKSHSWRAPWFYAWDPEGTRIEFWKY